MQHLSINLSKYIDHTLLRPESQAEQFKQLCEEARKYNFASVCVPPNRVELAKSELENCDVDVCTVVGFPFGYNDTKEKMLETEQAIRNGASEIDMVIAIGQLKEGNFSYVKKDIQNVLEVCSAKEAILKVIVETALLNDDEKIRLYNICSEVGVDFVKTSTGYSTCGATISDVLLMRKTLPKEIKIKASGGIKTKEFALELINAGADRLGCSASVKIMNE